MAARKNRGTKKNPMPDEWRKKIRASNIIKRLNDCVDGTVTLTAQQVKAADIILKKLEPDLNRTDLQTLDKDGKPADAVSKIVIEHVSANKK
jgi:hypothetical protein